MSASQSLSGSDIRRLVRMPFDFKDDENLGGYRSTAKMCHSPGTPLSNWLPRSPKCKPEPATRSFTVLDTNTSPAPASAATRAPM